jgi:hypothetical protein
MTKEEFLLKETRDLINCYKTQRSIPPTFTLLFENGSTESIALMFDPKSYKFFMQKLCENKRVIACTIITEGWLTTSTDETKSPSECDDREEIIMLLYNTRDNAHECHLYKPGKNGILELVSIDSTYQGRLSNPFGSAKNMTKEGKEEAILKFQESMRNIMCIAYSQLNHVVPMMFYLTNTPEQVSLRWIPEDEWNDKESLIQRITSKCAEPETIAFMLEFPVGPDIVNVILVTDEIHEIFHYNINTKCQKLEFVDKDIYDGEFSRLFKIIKNNK